MYYVSLLTFLPNYIFLTVRQLAYNFEVKCMHVLSELQLFCISLFTGHHVFWYWLVPAAALIILTDIRDAVIHFNCHQIWKTRDLRLVSQATIQSYPSLHLELGDAVVFVQHHVLANKINLKWFHAYTTLNNKVNLYYCSTDTRFAPSSGYSKNHNKKTIGDPTLKFSPVV